MSQKVDGETEILLGNKQVLGIFFILAVLFGVCFVAGYMLGHGSFKKGPADIVAQNTPAAPGETKSIGPASGENPTPAPPTSTAPTVDENAATPVKEAAGARDTNPTDEKRVAAPKSKPDKFQPLPAEEPPPTSHSNELYTPEAGQRFLQVAAEKRDSAEAVADVLTKSGLPAHVVAKPGDDKLFRVLVGPIKDNNDLTAKREALIKKGFVGVIPRNF